MLHASSRLLLFVGYQDGCSSEVSADSDRNSESDSDMGGVRSDGGFGERDPLDRRETLMCDRLQKVMQAMAVLIGCRLEYRCIEKLVSCASRVFRTVTKVSRIAYNKQFVLRIEPPSCLVENTYFTPR